MSDEKRKESHFNFKRRYRSESRFYVMPKIHKCKNTLNDISNNAEYVKLPIPTVLKGGPINGDRSNRVFHIGTLLEFSLKNQRMIR